MSQSTDSPDTPDKQLSHPFAPGTPLAKLFEKRVSQNRDIVIIVDDFNAGRGTGKSIASLQLGEGMDQTDAGLTKQKCTLDPEALRSYYTDRPKQSALVLDEGEVGASNREAITNVNKALREIMSMGRVEEKYVIINTPLKRFIDTDLQKLADVWISMTARGQGLVHFFKWHPYEEKLMTPKQQYLNFEDIPSAHRLRSVYHYLTREKRRKMNDSDEGEGFIEVSEHNEVVEREVKQARRETRDNIIARIATHPKFADVSQADIGEVTGVSQSKVSNVLNNR